MKHLLLTLALLPLGTGCTIGLPHGPIEPSISADCVDYLNENWIPAPSGGCADAACAPPVGPSCEAPPCGGAPCEGPACEGGCGHCPLLPPPIEAPPYVDPGPPGRFLPVPVRPVFSPQPMGVYPPAMLPPM